LINQPVSSDFGKVYREDGTLIVPAEYPVMASLQRGEVVENQLIGISRHDGLEVWLQLNSRPQWSNEGRVVAAVVSFTDVTGLKLVEESLRRGKERFEKLYQQFQALLEGISDRISLITPEMEIAWTNHDSGVGCIADRATYQGWCCYQQLYGRIDPCPDCPVVSCFAEGMVTSGEMTGADGRIWNLRAFPVHSAHHDGGILEVVLMAEEITEKRLMEQQSMRSNQLAALGELAAGVAHEINNPISGVINYAQLIANYTCAESRENDLALRIIREGDRIATIVRELLVFARNETQEVQAVSVREALGEALTLCEAALRKEQITLQIDLPADLPKVESRSHQIQQLFLNLLVNARHALSEKYANGHDDKLLKIGSEVVMFADRPFVRIKVRDHGSGIPPELLEKVMNPFFTTKPAGIGTGLGLSISFEIAKRHGGALRLTSEYGQWTEAVVDLPAAESAVEPAGRG
jgi:signal transduction histidine kinase